MTTACARDLRMTRLLHSYPTSAGAHSIPLLPPSDSSVRMSAAPPPALTQLTHIPEGASKTGTHRRRDPGYMSRKIIKFERINSLREIEVLTHVTHVNGWFPAVYVSCMSQNFRLFHVSNLSVRNFRIFLLMYPGSPTGQTVTSATAGRRDGGFLPAAARR